MELDKIKMKTITNIIDRPTVDIQFHNLCYNIGKKEILKSISGEFNSGQLIGILGSSGAGKTSLLNVLAGQLQKDVKGQIYVNKRPRILKSYRKMVSYIMQEDVIQPFLTVLESMTVAANLKLGQGFSETDKQFAILEVLSVIGLESCMNTKVENLSGGQRKRLIIALELVNNPPVIFLDEPTTGLDDVSMRHCVELLKSLALKGRTIICTIHQPSGSIFKLFDTVYFMSHGYCIYNGSVSNMIPFLSDAGHPCPTNYNPADFIIELVHFVESNTLTLKNKINNGEVTCFQDHKSDKLVGNFEEKNSSIRYSDGHEFPTSFWTQFSVLIKRSFLQLKRNKALLFLQFAYHTLCGTMVALMFFQIGWRASALLINVRFFFGVVIYIMFSYFMIPILLYPSEIKLLQREYFNRWYSLSSYFAALVIGLLPMVISTTIIFACLAYTLTGQPWEWYRFIWFTLVCILTAVASQRAGFIIGTIFDPTRGACIGSAISIPLVLLAMYGIGCGETIESYMKVIMSLSFPYHAYAGITTSILNDRGIIECDIESVCYFGDPNFVLLKMGMQGKTSSEEALYLFVFIILHEFLLYFLLKIRVAPEFISFRDYFKSCR